MSITISSVQRDALYDEVLTHLSGIGDLWLAVEREDYGTADHLGREFVDELTLILEDLGWGDESGDSDGPVELTSQADLLRRVLGKLRSRASGHVRAEEETIKGLREEQGRAQLVVDTCDEILTALSSDRSRV